LQYKIYFLLMYETLKFTEMTTRRVIDAKDKDGEKVYVKGHAKATYMSDGRTVEDAIKQIGTGGGGGGGIAVETDPIFSASPAAAITEDDIVMWNGAADLVAGHDTDISQLFDDIEGKQDAISDLATIRDGASKGATAVQAETLAGYALKGYVDAEVKALGDSLAEVASSGSYSDLSDKPTFKTINNESIVGSGNITISGGSGEVGPQGPQGDKGDTGVGVQSVAQTTTSNADGGSNVVTVTLTNGTKSTFTVKNGSKGSQGIQGEQGPKGDKGDKGDTGANGTNGTNGKDGADGDDGATFTPSVDSAGNLSWTNNKGLANPPTVNIKGPKGDTGEGGEDVVNTPKYIQWDYMGISFGAADEMTPNVKYVCTQPITDILFEESLDPYDCWHGGVTDLYNEYSIIFEANETSIEAPDYFRWVNGTIPAMENGVRYELSIALMYINNNYIAHAVLTPFKSVE
jgi:hypothetical protein